MLRKNNFFLLSCVLLFPSSAIFAKPVSPLGKFNLNSDRLQTAIRGKITDDAGNPIVGATIKLKSSTTVIVSGVDGAFTINANLGDVLEISYVGYQTAEFPITSASPTFTLQSSSEELDEVIVIGYGTTTRRSVVGAVDQISSKAIENRPVGNVTQALQGASPSLNIQQRSMDPNANTMNINIRGISTMNYNGPLIVIDGLVSENESLNKLNPADIESVSVLKDAGTAAIYGSRSANGVLLVTTKRGQKNQKPRVSVNSQVGLQDPTILYRPVAGYQNATLKNLALTNIGQNPQFTPSEIQDLYDNQSIERWNYDEILQSALQQNHNITIAGGSESTTYLFSGGFYGQESNFVGDNFGVQRYNLRSNISSEFGIFKLNSILAYSRNNSRSTTAANAIINSSRIPSYYYYGMQADNGKYLVNNALTDQNPLAELREGGYQKGDNDYFNVNLGLEAKLMDGLKLKGVFGADIRADHRFIRRIQVPLYANADALKPLVFVNSTRGSEDFNEKAYLLNYQLLLDYNKTFGKHTVSGLFGGTNESFTRTQNELKLRFTDPILGTPTTGTEVDVNGSSITPQRTLEKSITSLFGRVGYSYADKYFGEASFRYDGSSRFAQGYRWGFFPSVSLGWRVSEEDFLSVYKENVGDFKIRGSYGILGNQEIDDYQYLTTYESITNIYGFNNSGTSGAGFRYGDPSLRWESTYNFNIGFDATFLNNSLTASFDYFNKKTVDILLVPVTPLVFGTTLSDMNIGEMQNQGWELVLSYRLKTGEFNHNFSGNIGDSHNKVLNFNGREEISTADNITKITRAGLPFKSYYGYRTDGYFQNMQELETAALPVGLTSTDLRPGDVKYVDRNEDGIIDSRDRYVLGNGFPRYTFGFTYDVAYKGFDFSMFWQGVGKRDMMVRGELIEPFHENYSFAIYQHQLDYWTPTNVGARYPRLTAAGSASTTNNYQKDSDVFLFDGKYARLKNIQLGYSLPTGMVNKIGLQKVRAFVNAQNLFTLSLNSWIDPESSEFDSNMGGSANSARNYPTLKYYGFGLDIQF
ncbi:SusC/RagA family TonB-linked outer membrane protein [Sphingobacterium hungaricum]|uniref:SusC/RagA family TonB-linked outer membrane protein n=1 Tax=Sphingobacterium hungaricum TaxID=2082723 RepID=A0A928YQB3_9SPHI|nr:TonB-dependent receptor [Sphingobacterium hungaricum]MBE8713774.1 SusC/RagA family TonB-linked outer membrane protein [Sphingobacterium hungaricum]